MLKLDRLLKRELQQTTTHQGICHKVSNLICQILSNRPETMCLNETTRTNIVNPISEEGKICSKPDTQVLTPTAWCMKLPNIFISCVLGLTVNFQGAMFTTCNRMPFALSFHDMCTAGLLFVCKILVFKMIYIVCCIHSLCVHYILHVFPYSFTVTISFPFCIFDQIFLFLIIIN